MSSRAALPFVIAISGLVSLAAQADVGAARANANRDAWIVNGTVNGQSEADLRPGQRMEAPGQAGPATMTNPALGRPGRFEDRSLDIGGSGLTTGGKRSSSVGGGGAAGGPSGATTGSSSGYTTGNMSGTGGR